MPTETETPVNFEVGQSVYKFVAPGIALETFVTGVLHGPGAPAYRLFSDGADVYTPAGLVFGTLEEAQAYQPQPPPPHDPSQ